MDHLKNIVSQQDLKTISNCKSKYRKCILLKADKELINIICECVYNTLLGNVKLSEKDRLNLFKYKNILRRLVEKSTLQHKKKILIQKGGFLQFIIPAVITGIASIISSVINNNNE